MLSIFGVISVATREIRGERSNAVCFKYQQCLKVRNPSSVNAERNPETQGVFVIYISIAI